MPELVVLQSTFERLQRHARPLVDTVDSVINRALDALEQQDGQEVSDVKPVDVKRQIDPQSLPSMTHTRILDATVAGETVVHPSWNMLFKRVLIRAMDQVANFDELRRLCPVNLIEGREEGAGYQYLSELDVSYFNLPADKACGALVAVARSLDIGIEVTFKWLPKKGAERPGERAHLSMPEKQIG